jgi:AcrR family transcriptional regulator
MKNTRPSSQAPQNFSARERILYSAHELFYQDGIRATGIDRLIAASGVTKVTFYRHFPSKDDLTREFLEYRHHHWIAWFRDALFRHGATAKAIVPTLAEWLNEEGFRGCAFINSVSELGVSMPEIAVITREHKQEMVAAIAGVLAPSRQRRQDAHAIALAIDGAIVQAQFDQSPDAALSALKRILKSLLTTELQS